MDRKSLNIPNLLSLLRILLIPAFATTYLSAAGQEDYSLAASILLFSGITDLVDGFVARRFNMVTNLGKVLDPLADKLTQATVCVCLAVRHPHLTFLLIIFIVKEVLIFCGGIHLYKKSSHVVTALWFGKLYTAVFFAVMVGIVLLPQLSEKTLFWILGSFLLLTVFVFYQYLKEFLRINKNKNNG